MVKYELYQGFLCNDFFILDSLKYGWFDYHHNHNPIICTSVGVFALISKHLATSLEEDSHVHANDQDTQNSVVPT